MNIIKEMLTRWADSPYIEHEDYTRCGQCLREKIKSDISKAYLEQGKLSKSDLVQFQADVESKWKESELYTKFQNLKAKGLSLDEALSELEKQGYIP